MRYTIYLGKEDFKFSCSHFTIWNAHDAERLHGHNYYASVEIEVEKLDRDLGLAFDFNLVKPVMRELTLSWDEYVLVPGKSKFLSVVKKGAQVELSFASGKNGIKIYSLPEADVRILDCTNITAEELARLLAEQLAARLALLPAVASKVKSLRLSVEETRGQRVTYQLEVPDSTAS